MRFTGTLNGPFCSFPPASSLDLRSYFLQPTQPPHIPLPPSLPLSLSILTPTPSFPPRSHGTTLFEFLAANITPALPSRFAQPTPRKYTYKSCTVAVVMLADLPPGLPGLPLPPTRWPRSDLCDYVSIENAGLNVRDACLSIVEEEGAGGRGLRFVNPTGYNLAGVHGAIGVFLWDTDSVLNRAVKEGVGWGGGGDTS